MKIYFEDGMLNHVKTLQEDVYHTYILDATLGVKHILCILNLFKSNPQLYRAIYTNSILALDNDYVWNEELKTPEIYIRNNVGEWHLLQEFTDKELRKPHNLSKMYIAGAFTK